jgi:hypothetical protein
MICQLLPLGIFIGLILGVGSTCLYFLSKSKGKEVKEKFLRRGIFTNTYTTVGGKSFDVQFELGELEKTSARSKVEVISMTADQSEFNTDLTKKRIGDMVNNTWLKSEGIEWIEDDVAKKRNDKIEQILK